MICEYCEKPVDGSTGSNNYRQVTGWVKLRKKGANEVKLRKDLDRFIHRSCMTMLTSGVHPDQSQLAL